MFRLFLLLFIVTPIYSHAQYDGIYDIPLPEEFADYQESVIIYSSPNPDFPVYSGEEGSPIVWKHKTVIKAAEDLKIIETGAYLLNRGEWMLRATFQSKLTQKMFNTRSLKLSEGDSIVFQENWRYGNHTQTGWNFWYVKAINKKGEKIYGYEILETKGRFKDGLQILPLINKESGVAGRFTDEIEKHSVIKMQESTGSIHINNDSLISFAADIQFNISKHSANTDIDLILKNITATPTNNSEYLIEGEVCINEECSEEEWYLKLISSEKTHRLSFDLNLDAHKYLSNLNDSIEQLILTVSLSFKKDYPGSMPWNDLGEYGQ